MSRFDKNRYDQPPSNKASLVCLVDNIILILKALPGQSKGLKAELAKGIKTEIQDAEKEARKKYRDSPNNDKKAEAHRELHRKEHNIYNGKLKFFKELIQSLNFGEDSENTVFFGDLENTAYTADEVGARIGPNFLDLNKEALSKPVSWKILDSFSS